MVLAIFVFAPIGLPAWYWLVASRILGIPLIAGLSYEVIKWAGQEPPQALGARRHVAGADAAEPDDARAGRGAARGGDRLAERSWRWSPRMPPSSDRDRRLADAGDIARTRFGVIEQLVEQIEARFAELERADVRPGA